MPPASSPPSPWRARWQRFSSGSLQAFHSYANWLVGISWKRFILLSVLLMILAGVTSSLPLFSWTVTETVEEPIRPPKPPSPPKPSKPLIKIEKGKPGADSSSEDGIEISIDERGIRIRPRSAASPAASAASAPSAPASPASPASVGAAPKAPKTPKATGADDGISIALPPGVDKEIVRDAIEDAKQAIRDVVEAQREAARDAAEAVRDAREAAREADEISRQATEVARRALGDFSILPVPTHKVTRTRVVHWGDFIPELAFFWIVFSMIVKLVYKGRVQAEVKAAQATETAEAESLKRQVVEARMAAMQAQVEPHFLFNTLASIDHLIETDPARASQMQKNLIALLRASMPTMREANANGVRDLGRELSVIRPYLEILKVRMEERLSTSIDVPEGLQSAEFPPMMIQSLVENAIKHGLEPKAEGGSLAIRAEILHGKLAVSVADTGLGFGKAATAGTGVGLANIRERLTLLYGGKASLTVTENQPTGTVVTITVPYRPVEGTPA